MKREIYLSEVLAETNKANAVFSLKYRKADGSIGRKDRCVRRTTGNNELNERKKMNRSGLLPILVPANGDERDITIDLLVEFNGMTIRH